ncbi:MAG: hypothetical protein VCD00_02815 [Candidatus Hydrogenedentota bacterium]
MPDAPKSSLRIYCVCGQKMKVKSSMYGLPGKCIACRQKIRLPRLDELEEGITEIYLKDHPHLLRKVKKKRNIEKETRDGQSALDAVTPTKKPPKKTSKDEPTPVTELDIADASDLSHEDVGGSLPLDELESLRRLTSIQLILQRKRSSLKKEKSKDDTLIAETEGHLIRLKKMRDEFSEQMRQRLMEVAIELANTHDKISRTQITARVGEEPFEVFQEAIHRLRSRRERLERRQINIRGWLATTSPYTTGGLMDVAIADIPDEGFTFNIPSYVQDDAVLLNSPGDALKRAFGNRSKAEKEAIEIKKLRSNSEGSDSRTLTDAYETNRAQRKIARAQVVFYQQRLEQLAKDYRSDCDTLEACMEAARDRMGVNQISRTEYDRLEQNARRTKADLLKGIALAKRYAHANAFEDVPESKGTFLNRLGPSGRRDSHSQTTIMLLRIAAALWIFSIFLPVVGNTSIIGAFTSFSSSGSVAGAVLMLPILAALITLGLTFLVNPIARSFSVLTIWSITALLMAFLINEAHFSLDLMANRFRSGGVWIARPGIVVLMVANLLTLIGAGLSLKGKATTFRVAGGTIIAVTLVLLVWIATNGRGSYVPAPAIELMTDSTSDATGRQSGVLRIANSGNRVLHLVSRRTDARNAYLYGIEKKIGAQSYSEVSPTGDQLGYDSTYPYLSVVPGGYADIEFDLPPGDYRMVLMPRDAPGLLERTFSVDYPRSDVIAQPDDDGSAIVHVNPESPLPTQPAVVEREETMPEPEPVLPLQETPAVQLAGVMIGPDQQPRFSIVLTLDPEQAGTKITMPMQEIIHDGWSITEYNRSQNAITLQKEKTLLVLRRGEKIVLREK